jgi:hypothetical protein
MVFGQALGRPSTISPATFCFDGISDDSLVYSKTQELTGTRPPVSGKVLDRLA